MLLTCLLSGCSDDNKLEDGSVFHLIRLGEEPDPNWEVMELALKPTIRQYYASAPLVIHRDSLSTFSAIDRKLLEAYPGDSMVFELSDEGLSASVLQNYFKDDESKLMRVAVLTKMNKQTYTAHVSQRMQHLEEQESKTILEWITTQNLDSVKAYDQIFLLSLDSTHRYGSQVDCDSVIKVYYKGFFLDGGQFDESEKSGFNFKVCEQGQLLQGISMAVGWMHPGDKLKIILPSQLAFGPRGSANGVVPPYTPVKYEIQISDQ